MIARLLDVARYLFLTLSFIRNILMHRTLRNWRKKNSRSTQPKNMRFGQSWMAQTTHSNKHILNFVSKISFSGRKWWNLQCRRAGSELEDTGDTRLIGAFAFIVMTRARNFGKMPFQMQWTSIKIKIESVRITSFWLKCYNFMLPLFAYFFKNA